MSYPGAATIAIPASSPPPVKRTGTFLSESAIHRILSPTIQLGASKSRTWKRPSGSDQDLENGLDTEPGNKQATNGNDKEHTSTPIGVPRTSRVPNATSDTVDVNGAPFDLSLLAAYLAINSATLADKESSQNSSADSSSQFDDMNSDTAIAALIEHLDESLYPPTLTDPQKFVNSLQPLNEPGTLIGKKSTKVLGMVLHACETTTGGLVHLAKWEWRYYMRYIANLFCSSDFRPLPKEFMRHLHLLLIFLKGPSEPKTPQEFLNFLKKVGGNSGVTVKLIWVLLQFSLFLFNAAPPDPSMSFTEYISSIFPSSKRERKKFSIKLDDIIAVGLKVEPVNFLWQHLNIENRTIQIYCPGIYDLLPLHHYKDSRFARELGISTLGIEVFASLHALYGHSAGLTKLASDLHIKPKDEFPGFFENLHLSHEIGEPKVLSGRLDALEELISSEGVWWRSLHRDTKKRIQERPFEFWGSILAALFSITVIIQTVTSVISCIYTIRQYQVSIPAANGPGIGTP